MRRSIARRSQAPGTCRRRYWMRWNGNKQKGSELRRKTTTLKDCRMRRSSDSKSKSSRVPKLTNLSPWSKLSMKILHKRRRKKSRKMTRQRQKSS